MTLADARELLEAALQARADERAYFVCQALDSLPEGHDAREPLEDVLAGKINSEAGIRTAYGALPPTRDDSATDGDVPIGDGGVTRREVLTRGAGAVAAGSLLAGTSGTVTGEGSTAAGEGTIPAPFDVLPTIDDPSDELRELAAVRLPPEAIPEKGPIPDHHHLHVVERNLIVPAWILETTRWRLAEHYDVDELDRYDVENLLLDHTYIHERFVTSDGRDAADVLLEEVRQREGALDDE